MDLLRIIYDDAIRATVEEVLSDTSTLFPFTYSIEDIRAHRDSGRAVYSNFPVPVDKLDEFAEVLRIKLAEIKIDDDYPLRDAFFVHTFRGMKGLKRIKPPFSDQRKTNKLALATVFHYVDRMKSGMSHKNKWWLDVGLHLSRSGMVLLPKRDSVQSMLTLCSHIDEGDASHILLETKRVRYDLIGLLGDACGYRLSFRTPSPAGVMYLQVYASEKIPTALIDGSKFSKSITVTQFLKALRKKDVLIYYSQMKQIYLQLYEKDASFPFRIEVRVESQNACEPFGALEVEDLLGHFYAVDADDWWSVAIYS